MSGTRELRVHGAVAAGFEPLRELFEHEMRTVAEEHAQLCVYHRGERVVDLWAAPADDAFSPDSLVNVFSSGKSLESIALAVLVGRGLLDYAAPVARYWPEFAANGKHELTVADVLRHEGGMAAFRTSLHPEDLLPARLKQNLVGAVIEGHALRYPTGGNGKREYHAITRGWILNELFRRVDPAGRTMGEFYEEEIRRPLGADVIIGVHEAELARIVNVKPLGWLFVFLHSLLPRAFGRKVKHHFFQIVGRILRLLPGLRHSTTRGAPPPFAGIPGLGFFNERSVSMGETPSAGAKCTARGLAKLAAVMAGRGRFAGREVLSEAAWKALHDAPTPAFMGFAPTAFTQGGVNRFAAVGPNATALERAFNTGREGYYGWMGFGGSIFQWHPEHEIGFAFVPTALHVLDLLNERGKGYQTEAVRCAERLAK
jgi:CubicO group peptidase (beta-lactamase class C family)